MLFILPEFTKQKSHLTGWYCAWERVEYEYMMWIQMSSWVKRSGIEGSQVCSCFRLLYRQTYFIGEAHEPPAFGRFVNRPYEASHLLWRFFDFAYGFAQNDTQEREPRLLWRFFASSKQPSLYFACLSASIHPLRCFSSPIWGTLRYHLKRVPS